MATLLPVIDLKNQVVVHGIAGQRERYQPVRSILTSDPAPGAVAAAFASLPGVTDVYVADLDALAGEEPCWWQLEEIAAAGLKIWLDAGLRRLHNIVEFQQRLGAVQRVIAPLESATSVDEISVAARLLGADGVFSLDLRNSKPATAIAAWQEADALQIADFAVEAGFRSLIVLDVAHVGVAKGPSTAELCRRIQARHPRLELVSGGGVRSKEDVVLLASAGCARVLAASALHNGKLL